MQLGDAVLHALPDLQAAAESLMRDTGTITRAGGSAFNPATGLIEPGIATFVYSGPLRIRQPSTAESEILFGEQQLTVLRFMVDVPHTTTGVRIDDIVTVTTTTDDDLPTRRFRVTGVPMGTFLVSKSFPCEAVE